MSSLLAWGLALALRSNGSHSAVRASDTKPGLIVAVSCVPIQQKARQWLDRCLATGKLATDAPTLIPLDGGTLVIPEGDPGIEYFKRRLALWRYLSSQKSRGDSHILSLGKGQVADDVKSLFQGLLPIGQTVDDGSFRFSLEVTFGVTRTDAGGHNPFWAPKPADPPVLRTVASQGTSGSASLDSMLVGGSPPGGAGDLFVYAPGQKAPDEAMGDVVGKAVAAYRHAREEFRIQSANEYRALYAKLIEEADAAALWSVSGRPIGAAQMPVGVANQVRQYVADNWETLGFRSAQEAERYVEGEGSLTLSPHLHFVFRFFDERNRTTVTAGYEMPAPHFESKAAKPAAL